MLVVGIILATIWPELANSDEVIDQILSSFALVFAVPYLIDFITLGWVKRLPYFWRVYRYIYRFMGVITLAPVYRGIYYGLITNISRWKFVSLLVGYMVLTFVLVMPDFNFPGATPSVYVNKLGISSMDGYYRDQPAVRSNTWAHIQSAQVTDGALHVFLPHKRQYEERILALCDEHLSAKGISDTFETKINRNLACLSSVYSFYIDGKELPASRFFMRDLEQTGQLGLETWIDIGHLPRGAYTLEVKVNIFNPAGETAALIPFFHANGAMSMLLGAESANISSDSATSQ